jgi:hypothetical protein
MFANIFSDFYIYTYFVRYEFLAAMNIRVLSSGREAVLSSIRVPNSYRNLLTSYAVTHLVETLPCKPDGTIRIFIDLILGSTSLLTEMSTRNISWW